MPGLDSSLGMTICSHCQARVLTSSLSRHLASYHGIGVQQRPRTSSNSTGLAERNEDDAPDSERPDYLDAAKGWGYLAREDGRYGSYPMHDDYGDEAEP